MRKKLGAIAALVTASAVLATAPSEAKGSGDHCAVRVTGQRLTGELVTTTPVCRASEEEAQRAASGQQGDYTAQSSFTIGVHYDGAGFTGSSFSVVGDNCNGGWLNLSSTWDNRISSTLNGCPRIVHYDGDYLTGAAESTYGTGGSLGSLNNRTNSIKYTS